VLHSSSPCMVAPLIWLSLFKYGNHQHEPLHYSTNSKTSWKRRTGCEHIWLDTVCFCFHIQSIQHFEWFVLNFPRSDFVVLSVMITRSMVDGYQHIRTYLTPSRQAALFLKMLVPTRMHGVIIQSTTKEIFTIMKTLNFTMRLQTQPLSLLHITNRSSIFASLL
jgi:hypothetical protein